MIDELDTRLAAHFHATLDGHRPVAVQLPARRSGPSGWRVAVAASLAVTATLGLLGSRSTPSPQPALAAQPPAFVPVASQFIPIDDQSGLVYVDQEPMQLVRNTGIRRTEFVTVDGRTRIAIAVPTADLYLTDYRVD
ncbi:MAG: hypothetical protein AAGD32_00440 [Planctomycetota bacterium]